MMENILKKFVLLIVLISSCISSNAYIKYFDKVIQNIALTKNNVYIGAVNSILKLDYKVSLLIDHTTGPKDDNPIYCFPSVEPGKGADCSFKPDAELKKVDNYNQILIITEGLSKKGSLLTCGTLYWGICEYLSLDTLKNENTMNKLGKDLLTGYVGANLPNASTIAMPSKDGRILYVARTMTYYISHFKKNMLHLITARKLLKNGKLQSLELLGTGSSTAEKISFESKWFYKIYEKVNNGFFGSYYPIYYTSGFVDDNSVYFTTLQRQNISLDEIFVSKLARITPNEDGTKKLKTYIETMLACQHNDINYNLLISASILDITDKYPDLPDYTQGDKILFGVFARSDIYEAYPNTYEKYAICRFSLNAINNEIRKITESCNAGPAVPQATWIDSKNCKFTDPFGFELVSLAPNVTFLGTVLHVEDKLKLQAIYSSKHSRGISLYASSHGHSLLKYAVISENGVEKLHQYGKKEFGDDGKDQSMFFKIVMDPTKSIMFLISKHHVARVPVVDCNSRESCTDCLRGPSCGWCTLKNRCTLKNACQDNEKPQYFVNTSVNACPTSTLKDSIFSIGEYAEITIITTNIPEDISTYQCQIGIALIDISRNGSIFKCDSFDFKDIPIDESTGEETVKVSIVSETLGKYVPVVTSTIVIFRCPSYKTCDKCVTGKYQCGWCSNEMTCRNHKGSCSDWITYKGYGSNESSQICPKLLNTPNTYLPSGMERKVILNGERFPKPSGGKSYHCILNIAKKEIATDAVWKNSTQLACTKKKYSYSDAIDSLEGIFTVAYGDSFIHSASIKVVLYKCSERKYCSLCLNAVGWNCGWCGAPQECRLKESCGQSIAVPRCPNPSIREFTPSKTSINASTELVIKGDDLGTRGDVKSITVAGYDCRHILEKHIQFQQITCEIKKVESVLSGYINVSLSLNGAPSYATSVKKFFFVKPEIFDFGPKSGPCSGGTSLTIKGHHLDAGNKVEILVGDYKCKFMARNSQNISCKTDSADSAGCKSRYRRATRRELDVCVVFDGHRVCSSEGFVFQLDPIVNAVSTNKGLLDLYTFFSGGQVLNIRGLRLNLIQNPKIIFTTVGSGNVSKTFESSCKVSSEKKMTCLAPNISSAFSGDEGNSTVWLGFKMANVMNLREYIEILVVSDPELFPFLNNELLHEFKNQELKIKGSGLSVLNEKDVKVTIAGVPCTIDGLLDDRLLAIMPKKEVLDKVASSDTYSVKVMVGEGGLEYNIGFVKYQEVIKDHSTTLYLSLAAAAGVLVILIVIISVCVLYRRRHLRDKKDFDKDLQLHMDKIESQYARECKDAFAEYTTERSDLTSDVDQEISPRREFRQFAMRVLYPGLDSHPILENNKDDRAEWERCMKSFINLLKDKDFILTFVRTLERQQTFQMTDRCIVASLLMVSLQDDIVFVTEILKELLTDLINKAGSGKRPKLLLRRTESIAEKLLTNWLAYTLFDFLRDVVGEPLFKLFTAVNILLDKEPADAITFDAKNSLSEDKLLRSKVDFKTIQLNIDYVHPKFGGIYEGIPVLSTDTITQCKEKILKNIYKNQPHSLRPLPDDLQLGHVGATGAIRYMQDCDASNSIEGEWKKLNTLGYVLGLHKIPECACLRLSHSTEALSANGSAMMDDSLPNVTFHSSISSTPMLYDCGMLEPKLYHLVKPSEYDVAKDDVRQSKMMAEVYLTRLLKTKETLLSFVNQLFESIFGLSDQDRVIPPSIKFLFDFLDSQAEKMVIEDADVHHTWKNNSLPLRFWINIIKNPDFVFDIRKSNTVDSCLSVIAQLFMDSCSPDEHRLGKDSPSNKLLYAKEIPGYKKEVKRFYKDVKEAEFDDKEFYGKLEEISSLYGKSFNSCNAAFELMSYAVIYKVKLMDNLEDNELAEDAEKLQEIMENLPDD